VRFVLLRHLAERRLSSGLAGWAEGSCVTSRRFHEAALRGDFRTRRPVRAVRILLPRAYSIFGAERNGGTSEAGPREEASAESGALGEHSRSRPKFSRYLQQKVDFDSTSTCKAARDFLNKFKQL
jgi:hypothetical protein